MAGPHLVEPGGDPERVESSASGPTRFTCEVVPERDAVRVRPLGGLRALLALNAQARSDGFELGLVRGNATVQRVFEVTGTTDLLPFTDS